MFTANFAARSYAVLKIRGFLDVKRADVRTRIWSLAWDAASAYGSRFRMNIDWFYQHCIYSTERLLRDLWVAMHANPSPPFPSVQSALFPGMTQIDSEDRLYQGF